VLFTINDSPFLGKRVNFVGDRLTKNRENLMKLGETDSADKFMVFGRGLHLSVLIGQ
jgi:GTP-binding protein